MHNPRCYILFARLVFPQTRYVGRVRLLGKDHGRYVPRPCYQLGSNATQGLDSLLASLRVLLSW